MTFPTPEQQPVYVPRTPYYAEPPAHYQNVIDLADVRIVHLQRDYARIDLAYYLDRFPVMRVETDAIGNQRAVPIESVDEDSFRYAIELFEDVQRKSLIAVHWERWYMSHPSVNMRHSVNALRARDREVQRVLTA